VSTSETVEARTPEDPVVLSDLASLLLDEASTSGSGTAAISLLPSGGGGFNQTVVAVARGHELGAERWNGVATLQVLEGTATLVDGTTEVGLGSGQLARMRPGAGSIRADEDLLVLLTVAAA
jgi:hypothetical protein